MASNRRHRVDFHVQLHVWNNENRTVHSLCTPAVESKLKMKIQIKTSSSKCLETDLFLFDIYAPKEKWCLNHESSTEFQSVFHVDILGDRSHPLCRKFAYVLVDNTDTDGIYGSNNMHRPQIKRTSKRNWASNSSSKFS